MYRTLDEDVAELLAQLPSEQKAEVVDGEVVLMSPTGDLPARAAENVFISLRLHERTAGGRAHGDNVGYVVDLPGRGSFSPDASYYTGESRGMGFLHGAPVFAVEVRSEGDYGERAEAKMARKRADYFAAGTQVVWDVDLLGPDTVRAYRAAAPDAPAVFRRGEIADAEPAVPGWRLPVDELYD